MNLFSHLSHLKYFGSTYRECVLIAPEIVHRELPAVTSYC